MNYFIYDKTTGDNEGDYWCFYNIIPSDDSKDDFILKHIDLPYIDEYSNTYTFEDLYVYSKKTHKSLASVMNLKKAILTFS